MATIRLTNDCPSTYVSVPGVFIEKYMTDANGEFVKVYLYLLHYMHSRTGDCSISAIADHFNHTENDVLRALKYWEKSGVLRLEMDENNGIQGVFFCDIISTEKNKSTIEKASVPVLPQETSQEVLTTPEVATEDATDGTAKDYTLDQVMKFSQDPDMQELLFIVESYLKHSLSPHEINTVFYWIDSLHFSKDLAEYLVEYSLGGGHTSLRYMDKIAMDWAKNGITTVDDAKNHSNNHSKTCYGVMKALGISGRNLIDAEIAYVQKWTQEYGFDMPLIEEACKRTISSISQPSFPYTDKILTDWHAKKVHNLNDVMALDANFSKTKKAASVGRGTKNNKFINFNQRNYDYEQLEKDILNTSIQ